MNFMLLHHSFGHSNRFSVPFHAETPLVRSLKPLFRSLSCWIATRSVTQTAFPFPFMLKHHSFGHSNRFSVPFHVASHSFGHSNRFFVPFHAASPLVRSLKPLFRSLSCCFTTRSGSQFLSEHGGTSDNKIEPHLTPRGKRVSGVEINSTV